MSTCIFLITDKHGINNIFSYTSNTRSSSISTNKLWLKYIICQEENDEKLCYPSNSKRSTVGAGSIGIAEILILFSDNGCLPKTLNILKFSEGYGLKATFHNILLSSMPHAVSSSARGL